MCTKTREETGRNPGREGNQGGKEKKGQETKTSEPESGGAQAVWDAPKRHEKIQTTKSGQRRGTHDNLT